MRRGPGPRGLLRGERGSISLRGRCRGDWDQNPEPEGPPWGTEKPRDEIPELKRDSRKLLPLPWEKWPQQRGEGPRGLVIP